MKTNIATFVGGLAVGAAAMYMLDPDRGKSRRALVRDKATSYARKGIRAARGKAEDLKHRAQGLIAKSKHSLDGGQPKTEMRTSASGIQ